MTAKEAQELASKAKAEWRIRETARQLEVATRFQEEYDRIIVPEAEKQLPEILKEIGRYANAGFFYATISTNAENLLGRQNGMLPEAVAVRLRDLGYRAKQAGTYNDEFAVSVSWKKSDAPYD